MDAASVALAQLVINGALSILALFRKQGLVNFDINERLDRVDNNQEPVTIAEVQASLDSWKAKLDAAKQVP